MKNISTNRKLGFNYEVVDTFIAGIKLFGTEVKSLRNNQCSISDGYCYFNGEELFIQGMTIPAYKSSMLDDYNPIRDRLLLLTKKELNELKKKVVDKGFTIIPMAVLLNNNGLFKLKIALCRGKKTYDKKLSLKLKDIDRDVEQELNNMIK